jgi:hypothetical protein
VSKKTKRKDPHAVAMAEKRNKSLSKARKSEIGKIAANARWNPKKK